MLPHPAERRAARPVPFVHQRSERAVPEITQHFRTIWISDVHLGTRGCRAEDLLDFLRVTESDKLYLVGDIVDGWRLKRHWYWPQAHNDVIQKLLRKARKGTEVIYIPGNHDEFARQFINREFGNEFGGVTMRIDDIHTTAGGKRMLVAHGDELDVVMNYAPWLAFIGDTAYVTALWVNRQLNGLRQLFGFGYWSLSAYLKHKVKEAVAFVGKFQNSIIEMARQRGVEGIVCGHIHFPEIRDIDGILYCNDGDWVETCSALVEHTDGRLEILRWFEVREAMLAASPLDADEVGGPTETSGLVRPPVPGLSTSAAGHG